MYKGQTITVIMPCLNEEQGVEQVLIRMPEFVDQVLVVDNGSTDGTSEVAARYGAQVIREDARGYGRSYKTGLAAACGDIIITLSWQSPLPDDNLQDVQAAVVKKELSISTTTLQRELGYDPDEEAELNAAEDARKITMFSRGQGMPPALPGVGPLPGQVPPSAPDDPAQQGGAQ